MGLCFPSGNLSGCVLSFATHCLVPVSHFLSCLLIRTAANAGKLVQPLPQHRGENSPEPSSGLCPKPQLPPHRRSARRCGRGPGKGEAARADAQLLRSQRWPLSPRGGWEDGQALPAQPGDFSSGLSLSCPSCATLAKSLNPPEPQGSCSKVGQTLSPTPVTSAGTQREDRRKMAL